MTDPLRLLVGTDSLISYSLSPDYATTKELVWTSDDEEIASVDAEGCIIAHKVGETNIRVQSKVGYVAMAILKLQVISEIIKVTDITVTPENPEVLLLLIYSCRQRFHRQQPHIRLLNGQAKLRISHRYQKME